MIEKAQRAETNLLLSFLPEKARNELIASSERQALDEGAVVADPERKIEHVFFPITGVLSILSVLSDRSGVETCVTGNEGLAPIGAFHRVDSAPEHVVVQVPGDVFRVPLERFREVVEQHPAFEAALHRHSMAAFTFAAQTSGCNRRHSVVQRCARWLLQTHDRVPGDEFHLTHLFLSQMLGVRRSSVTVAAESLRAGGAIMYTRGTLRVVDRAKLESRSCECYAIVRSMYDRMLGSGATQSPLHGIQTSEGGQSLVHAGEPPRLSGESPLPTERALESFRVQVRRAHRRREEMAARIGEGNPLASQLDEELSVALEQLQVAEEELRVQMESLTSVRDSLELEQRRWRARLDALPEAFIETDKHDTIVEVNRAAESLLGRERDYLVGRPLPSLMDDEGRGEFRRVANELRRQTEELRWLGKFRSEPKGTVVETSVSCRSIIAAEGPSRDFEGARWLLRRRVLESPLRSRFERR